MIDGTTTFHAKLHKFNFNHLVAIIFLFWKEMVELYSNVAVESNSWHIRTAYFRAFFGQGHVFVLNSFAGGANQTSQEP